MLNYLARYIFRVAISNSRLERMENGQVVAGSALLIGAALGYFARIPPRLIAAIMAFGTGVLISALSFDLMDGI